MAIEIIAVVVLFSFLEVGGLKMFAVKSGSMEPEVGKGSIVFTKPASEYMVGDIITYQISNGSDYVTHRISGIEEDESKMYYRTKGDANSSEDFAAVSDDRIVGKLLFKVPYVGFFVQYTKTLPGLMLLIIIPATIIIYEEVKKIRIEAKEIIKKRKMKASKAQKAEKEAAIKKEKTKEKSITETKKSKTKNKLKKVGEK